ncbi:MAG: FAD binding domain-containing protein [Bacteroidales bacterium]|nr:FAD binding domain-containing protein [Bacteroidales bacterium]
MSEGYIPKTLKEALEIRRSEKVIPIAGGTDLMVQHRREGGVAQGFEEPLLLLNEINNLKTLKTDGDKIVIGAGVLLNDLVNNNYLPYLIRETARQMAAVTTRNVATIGGNICNASPAADTLPLLYATNATLVLQSADKKREVPMEEFVTGPGQSCLQPDELLIEVHIPKEDFDVEYYRKVGTRKAMALSKISFAGLASFSDGKLSDIRIALGAVAPKVVRDKALEKRLKDLSRQEIKEKIPEIRHGYAKHIRPIDDARSSKEYRKAVSLDLIQEFIEGKILNSA